jgi:hypothetical protein
MLDRTTTPEVVGTGCARASTALRLVQKATKPAPTYSSLVVALGLLAAGCDGPVPNAEGPIVTDSAGIRIVESPKPRLDPGTWQVTGEPEVLCAGGGPSGDPRVFQARGLLPLVGGGVALLAGGGYHVLVCRGGEVVADYGGRGQGPGEFASGALTLVRGPGDSVVVVEGGALTVLDLQAGGSRRIPVWTVAREVAGVSRFMGGLEGVVALRVLASPGERADLVVLDLQDLPAPLARMSGVPWSPALGMNAVQTYLWPGFRYALDGERYWWGDVETGEVRGYGSSGLEEIRRAPVSLPVADAERVASAVEGLSNSLRASNPGLPDEIIATIVVVEHPVRPPAVLAVVPAPNGELWVQVPQPGSRANPRWRVFAPAGEWLTDVELPLGFHLRAVKGDHLLGVRFAEFGLEWVERLTVSGREPTHATRSQP